MTTNNDTRDSTGLFGFEESGQHPKWGSPEWSEMSEEQFGQALFAKLDDSPAMFSRDDAQAICNTWNRIGIPVRAAILSQTKTPKEIAADIIGDDRFASATAHIITHLEDAIKLLEELPDMLTAMEWRLKAALCHREDMAELLETAKNEMEVAP
jgi:hypothetical protein